MKARSLRWALLVLSAVPAGHAVGQAAPVKIAVVDLRGVRQQTPGYAKAESTFTKELEGYRAEVAKMQDSLETAQKDFDKSSVVMSPAVRAQKRKDLDAQQSRLEQRTNELQQRAAQREQELLAPIQSRVNSVIEGIRGEAGYQLILDVSAVNSGILFADRTLDITPKVLERVKSAP